MTAYHPEGCHGALHHEVFGCFASRHACLDYLVLASIVTYCRRLHKTLHLCGSVIAVRHDSCINLLQGISKSKHTRPTRLISPTGGGN